MDRREKFLTIYPGDKTFWVWRRYIVDGLDIHHAIFPPWFEIYARLLSVSIWGVLQIELQSLIEPLIISKVEATLSK